MLFWWPDPLSPNAFPSLPLSHSNTHGCEMTATLCCFSSCWFSIAKEGEKILTSPFKKKLKYLKELIKKEYFFK